MKKKLVSYLILACSVFGLAMVGSCKDYEDEFKGYRSEIDNLKTDDGTLKARIDSVSNAVQNLKNCACDPTLKARLDSLSKFIGDTAGGDCDQHPEQFTADAERKSRHGHDCRVLG